MVPKELVIRQIPDEFSPLTHEAIDVFCFEGKENIYPDWYKSLHFDWPFDTPELRKEADYITSQEAMYYVRILGVKLNKMNNLNYSYKFWFTIIYPWLVQAIQIVWIRQQTLLSFFNKNDKEYYTVNLLDVKKKYNWKFKGTVDFHLVGYTHDFNEWIYSLLLDQIESEKISKKIISKVIDYSSITSIGDVSFARKQSFKALVYKLIYNTKVFTQGYNVNLFKSTVFDLLLRIKRKERSTYNIDNIPSKSNLDWIIDIESFLWQVIPDSILNIRHYLNKVKLPASSIIHVSSTLYFHDFSKKILVAKAREKGVKIIAGQHGGHNYASSITCEAGKRVEFDCDYFITWGWDKQSDYNFNAIKLPSPMLSKLADKHKVQNENIIFVASSAKLVAKRFTDNTPGYWLKHRIFKETFFDHISRQVRTNLLYRPYFNELGGLKDYSFYKEKYDWLTKLEGSLDDYLISSQLLLLDHPGTTLNKAYAANTPTILLFPPGGYFFSKQTIPYFKKMKSLGLLFENPIEAAKIINSKQDIESWWHSNEIQDFRKDWMHKYARADKNWFWQWVKALWNL